MARVGSSADRGLRRSVVALAAIIVFSVVGPFLYGVDPWRTVAAPFVPPFVDWRFLLGTDLLGRDVLAGVINGARITLLVGIASALVATVVGVAVGATAGYLGGYVDVLLTRLIEFFQTIPTFILAILIVSIWRPTIWTIVLAIAGVSWPAIARVARGEFMSLKTREFVEAAKLSGSGTASIVMREILPNAAPAIAVATSLSVAMAILLEAALSFLGLGDPNLISWGYMIGASRNVIRIGWWMSVFPGFAILVTVLAINAFGDRLTDYLNPRLRGGI